MAGKKKGRSPIEVFDATGEVIYRAYVENPAQGLRGASLEGFVAPLAQLQGLDLSRCTLYWASLREADLSFANLAEADLRGASLDGAICRNTNFRDSNLSRDNLGGRTSLKRADLTGATLDGANLMDAVFDDETRFPEGFDPVARGMVHVAALPPNDPRRKN